MQGLSTKRDVEGSPKSWAFVNHGLHDVSALVLLAHGHPTPQGPGTKNTTIAMLWLTVGTWWDMVIVYLWCSQVLPGICHRVWKLWAPWYRSAFYTHVEVTWTWWPLPPGGSQATEWRRNWSLEPGRTSDEQPNHATQILIPIGTQKSRQLLGKTKNKSNC